MRAPALAAFAVVTSFTLVAAGKTIVVSAKADGATDATPAIAAALKSAAAGDVVSLPAGTYALAGTLAIPANVTFAGAGMGKTVLKATGTVDSMIDMSGVDHAVVRDLSLDGGGTHANNGFGAANATHLEIDQVEVFDFHQTTIFGPFGVYWSANVTDSIVHRSKFHDLGPGSTWGVAVRIETGKRDVIEQNSSLHTGRGAYHIKLTTDTIVRGNTGHDYVPASDALGIEAFQACDRVVIEDNEIDSWLSLDSTPFAAVRRNKLVPTMTTHAGSIGLEIVASPDVVMTDNLVKGPLAGDIGVSVDSTPYLVLARNVIDGTRGTLLEAQWNSVDSRPPTVGIYSYANQYLNAPVRAIHPHGENTSGLVFDHDVVKDWGSDGFFIQAPRVLLDGVTLQRASGGAGFFTDSTETYVRACTGTGCPSKPPALPSPSPLPSAYFASAVMGMSVAVNATKSSDPGGSKLHAIWDFGEGPAVTGLTASHTYAASGKKTIALVVWNANGWGARTEQTLDVGVVSDAGTDGDVDAATDAPADDAAIDAADAAGPDPDAANDAASDGDVKGGCGCRSARAGASASWTLLLFGAVFLRRFRACRRSRSA